VLATAEQLRRETASVTPQFRADALRDLRQTAVAELEAAGLACGGGWSLPDRADRSEQEDEEYDEIDYDDYEDPDEWI
jgi:hypothetical protein